MATLVASLTIAGCQDDGEPIDDAMGPATTGPGSSSAADDPADDDDDDDDDDTPTGTCGVDLEPELTALGVPGLSAGVIKDGKLHCTAVAGMASIEDDRPVAADTVFEWASVSKTIVATAIMILVEEGQLGLDDDVGDHLPFAVRNPACPDQPITIRQIMTHTSSIIDNEAVYDASYTVGDSPVALGDFLRDYLTPTGALYDAEENYDYECPGSYNEYSNIAAGGVLGHLVEQVSAQDFNAFCRARIFDPLGMTETSFRLSELDVDNVAVPYEAQGGGFVALEHPGYATYPDGLLRTSAPHLARFLAMIAEGGIYDGQRILSEASIGQMSELQIPELDETQGLIWYYDFDGLLGHDGEDDGYSSLMFFDPSDGSGALLVGNAIWWDSEAAALDLFERLMATGA